MNIILRKVLRRKRKISTIYFHLPFFLRNAFSFVKENKLVTNIFIFVECIPRFENSKMTLLLQNVNRNSVG